MALESRAVYSQADVYLLDDPLSAVDAHVGSHLFESCICGMLKDTTRVLVTHQQQFLPEAGRIAVFKDGTIEHLGTYDELLDKGVNFQEFALDIKEEEALGKLNGRCDNGRSCGHGCLSSIAALLLLTSVGFS